MRANRIMANTPRPMLTEKRREALSKTYSLVGTHSAVKLCRWQKSMMRGRGGCYKYTMYGIESHRCMEATPSLGCANKCTFCWRLNSNPTVKAWNFLTDEPKNLVDIMIETHRGLVHNAKGIPGAITSRVDEALQPKHCALSLVGEPIIYPRINEFVDRLHERGISSFLVNNGQFPEAIRDLKPVTQLYLSVDAPNKSTMKALDRPVFDDFWERFLRSVDFMAQKKGRTVFRLTLIEGHNMDDIQGYADIVSRGTPDMIELKQVTPTFQSKSSPFRLSNVPDWKRIIDVGRDICRRVGDGKEYDVACAHEHSKCLLLARRSKFLTNGSWHTWINFDEFHRRSKEMSLENLSATDFNLPTPSWAVFGAAEEGFDPGQCRHISNKKQRWLDQNRTCASLE